jgi:hypothetical protein
VCIPTGTFEPTDAPTASPTVSPTAASNYTQIKRRVLCIYFSFYLYPDSDDERNLSDLARKTLIGLIRAPQEQGLEDAFFNEYLGCNRQDLTKLVLKDTGMDEIAKAAYLSTPLPPDELEIARATLAQILEYFSIVTMDLQHHLNLKLRQRQAEDKAFAHAAKMNVRKQSEETACDLDKEPATKPDEMSTVIRNEARDAVANELRSQQKKKARKNSLGDSTAQKRAAKRVKLTFPKNDTRTKDGKQQNKKKKKQQQSKKKQTPPKSILKKDGKHQGGANKGGDKNKKKKKLQK